MRAICAGMIAGTRIGLGSWDPVWWDDKKKKSGPPKRTYTKKKARGSVKAIAPGKGELQKLKDELYWQRQQALSLSVLNAERAASEAAQVMAFASESVAQEQQSELTARVFSIVPYVLGGVGLLMGTALYFKVRRKKR